LKTELEAYKTGLSSRVALVIANKADAVVDPEEGRKKLEELQMLAGEGVSVMPISARLRHNTFKALDVLRDHVERARLEAMEVKVIEVGKSSRVRRMLDEARLNREQEKKDWKDLIEVERAPTEEELKRWNQMIRRKTLDDLDVQETDRLEDQLLVEDDQPSRLDRERTPSPDEILESDDQSKPLSSPSSTDWQDVKW